MSIPDLEVEANASDVNDARAEEKAMPGTPAFELREACALYEYLMTRRKSAEEVSLASAISKIKLLLQKEKESLQDNRTGHWVQHLEAFSEMRLYMEASSHNLCTKLVHDPSRECTFRCVP